MKILEKKQNLQVGILIHRISISSLILFHGTANTLSNYSFIKSLLAGLNLPSFIAYGVFLGEIVAPILIGYRAKIGALLLAFNMLLAILLAHSPDVFTLNQFGGWGIELQGLYLFGAIAVFFIGAGKYSLSSNSKWD